MAKSCAFCGKSLGLFESTYLLIDGSGAEICMSCTNHQHDLKKAMDADDQAAIDAVRARVKAASARPEEAEKHIDSILSTAEERRQEKRRAIEEAAAKEAAKAAAQAQKDRLLVTTGYSFEGWRIVEYMGIISGEVALGTGYFSDWEAALSDFSGMESEAYSGKLTRAKEIALDRMKEACARKGGNAIIGADFDYVTFTGNMMGVIANGTAVRVEKGES